MECKLLRTLDFKLDMEAFLANCTYTRTYSRCMYEPMVGASGAAQVAKLAEAISNDSFFTCVNLLYPVQTVALAAVLLSATRFKNPTPLSESSSSSFCFDGCFHLQKMRFLRREKRLSPLTAEEETQMR